MDELILPDSLPEAPALARRPRRPCLRVDLGELEAQIVEQARRAHLPPSTWVLGVVAGALGERFEPERRGCDDHADDGGPTLETATVRLHLRLAPSLLARLVTVARREGTSHIDWLSRRIDNPATLRFPPEFAEAVLQCEYDLQTISSDLDDVARAYEDRHRAVTSTERQTVALALQDLGTSLTFLRQVLQAASSWTRRRGVDA